MRHAKTIWLSLFFLLLTISCQRQPAEEVSTLATREPDPYRATVIYSYRPGGNRGVKPNQLFTLEVARRGADRRYVFNFSDRQLIYLEGPQRHYLIAPACRHYVDATLEAMNFRIPSSMAPEELVAQLQRTGPYRALGEEQLAGRAALKYAPAQEEEKLIYLDKATGLPLRVEVVSQVPSPTRGREAAGEHGNLPVIVEFSEIRTEVDPALFDAPAGMTEVTPQELCAQVRKLADSAMQYLWSISDRGGAQATR